MKNGSSLEETIGLDLSDRTGLYVVLSAPGEVVGEGTVMLSRTGVERVFAGRQPCRIALEVGTHSPWLSRQLEALGYEVIVANARQVGLIARSGRKTDRVDAETLTRAARFDPALLKPIRHRGEQAQADLAMLRARKALLASRTRLVISTRGMVKAVGGRLPKGSADYFASKVKDHLPQMLRPALEPMLASIAGLTEQVRQLTRELKKLAQERYPETALLSQVPGVGPFGPDSDLRRWGLGLAGTGSKMRKNKAIIAVARKLCVLLHRLWLTGQVYEPLRQSCLQEAA